MGTRTININDQTIEYWYSCGYCDLYSHSEGTKGFYYFDDIKLALGNVTPNQIVSSKMSIVPQSTASGTRSWGFNYGAITSPWTEETPNSAATGGGGGTLSFSSVNAGTAIALDTTQITRDLLAGTPNYGIYLSFGGPSPSTLYFWTSEATDPSLRPSFEVVVDTSRPKYPAPTSGPSGMSLTPGVGSATATWSGVPANIDSVTVEFNCSMSGNSSITLAGTARSATKSGLQTGERCSTRALTTNDGGSSPLTMSTSEVTILGVAPTLAPKTSLTLSTQSAYVIFTDVDPVATEVVVTLTCSVSGSRYQTVATGTMQVIFRDVRDGETCNASSKAQNQWGSSPSGQMSNSQTLAGALPLPPNIRSTSTVEGRIDIAWDSAPTGATSVNLSLQCNKSGSLDKTFLPGALAGFFMGLTPGDVCSVRGSSANQWGTSATSTLNSNVVVFSKALTPPTISNVDVSIVGSAIIDFVAPKGAVQVKISLECSVSGIPNPYVVMANLGRLTINNLHPGESCNAQIASINASGTPSVAYEFDISPKGIAPSAPTGISVVALSNRVDVVWNAATSDSYLSIQLVCNQSGTQRDELDSIQKRTTFAATAGESCYVLASEINDWGESPVVRTETVKILKAYSTPTPRATVSPTPTPTVTTKATTKPSPTPVKSTKSPGPMASKSPTATAAAKLTLVVTCTRGSLRKVLTTDSPKCPAGWKVKTVIPVQ
jgi:hypothetical protein